MSGSHCLPLSLLLSAACGHLTRPLSLALDETELAAHAEPVDALALAFADGLSSERVDVFVRSFLEHSPPRSRLVLFGYRSPPDVGPYDSRVSVVRAVASSSMHLSNHRYSLYREYVERLGYTPRVVLNSDVSDVVFQANPFVGNASGSVYTSLEGRRTFGDGSLIAWYNEKWIRRLRRCSLLSSA